MRFLVFLKCLGNLHFLLKVVVLSFEKFLPQIQLKTVFEGLEGLFFGAWFFALLLDFCPLIF